MLIYFCEVFHLVWNHLTIFHSSGFHLTSRPKPKQSHKTTVLLDTVNHYINYQRNWWFNLMLVILCFNRLNVTVWMFCLRWSQTVHKRTKLIWRWFSKWMEASADRFFLTLSMVICCRGFFLVTNVRLVSRFRQKRLLNALNVKCHRRKKDTNDILYYYFIISLHFCLKRLTRCTFVTRKKRP